MSEVGLLGDDVTGALWAGVRHVLEAARLS